jgi:hypothetical protein
MYVAIRRYERNMQLGGRLADSVDEVRSLMSAVPGFRSYYYVQGDGDSASITVCDDRAGVDESTRVAAEWVRANAPDAVSGPPLVLAGEVVASF